MDSLSKFTIQSLQGLKTKLMIKENYEILVDYNQAMKFKYITTSYEIQVKETSLWCLVQESANTKYVSFFIFVN